MFLRFDSPSTTENPAPTITYAVSSSSQCRDCDMLTGVLIVDGNGLILIGEVSDDTFCQYIERLAK